MNFLPREIPLFPRLWDPKYVHEAVLLTMALDAFLTTALPPATFFTAPPPISTYARRIVVFQSFGLLRKCPELLPSGVNGTGELACTPDRSRSSSHNAPNNES